MSIVSWRETAASRVCTTPKRRAPTQAARMSGLGGSCTLRSRARRRSAKRFRGADVAATAVLATGFKCSTAAPMVSTTSGNRSRCAAFHIDSGSTPSAQPAGADVWWSAFLGLRDVGGACCLRDRLALPSRPRVSSPRLLARNRSYSTGVGVSTSKPIPRASSSAITSCTCMASIGCGGANSSSSPLSWSSRNSSSRSNTPVVLTPRCVKMRRSSLTDGPRNDKPITARAIAKAPIRLNCSRHRRGPLGEEICAAPPFTLPNSCPRPSTENFTCGTTTAFVCFTAACTRREKTRATSRMTISSNSV